MTQNYINKAVKELECDCGCHCEEDHGCGKKGCDVDCQNFDNCILLKSPKPQECNCQWDFIKFKCPNPSHLTPTPKPQQKACSGRCNDFNFGHRKDCALNAPTPESWERYIKSYNRRMFNDCMPEEQIGIEEEELKFIRKLLAQQRQLYIEKIREKNFKFMESCEPDCDAVRHARHEGSWKHYIDMENYLDQLLEGEE